MMMVQTLVDSKDDLRESLTVGMMVATLAE